MNNAFKLNIGFAKEHSDTIAHIVILSSAVSGYFPCKSSMRLPIEEPDELFAYIKKRIKSFVKSSRSGHLSTIPLYNRKRSKVDKYIELLNNNGKFSVSIQEIVTL